MIVESCAKTWPVCHRSFVDWLAGLDDSLDISHIPGFRGPARESRRGRGDVAPDDRDETTRLSGRAPPPVGPRPWPPPPSIDDTSDLPESAESECWSVEVERIAKTSEAAPSARASRPVVATRARQSTDDRPPRPPDHIRYVGVPTGDRLLIRSGRPAAKPVLIVRNGARGETAETRMANRENPEITMIRYVTYEVISANHRTPPHAPARVPARAILILTALDSSLPPPSIPRLSHVLDCRDKRAGTNSRRSVPRTQT
jgi:hypothetical protein